MIDLPQDPPAICVQQEAETENPKTERDWREVFERCDIVVQSESGGGGTGNPPRPPKDPPLPDN